MADVSEALKKCHKLWRDLHPTDGSAPTKPREQINGLLLCSVRNLAHSLKQQKLLCEGGEAELPQDLTQHVVQFVGFTLLRTLPVDIWAPLCGDVLVSTFAVAGMNQLLDCARALVNRLKADSSTKKKDDTESNSYMLHVLFRLSALCLHYGAYLVGPLSTEMPFVLLKLFKSSPLTQIRIGVLQVGIALYEHWKMDMQQPASQKISRIWSSEWDSNLHKIVMKGIVDKDVDVRCYAFRALGYFGLYADEAYVTHFRQMIQDATGPSTARRNSISISAGDPDGKDQEEAVQAPKEKQADIATLSSAPFTPFGSHDEVVTTILKTYLAIATGAYGGVQLPVNDIDKLVEHLGQSLAEFLECIVIQHLRAPSVPLRNSALEVLDWNAIPKKWRRLGLLGHSLVQQESRHIVIVVLRYMYSLYACQPSWGPYKVLKWDESAYTQLISPALVKWWQALPRPVLQQHVTPQVISPLLYCAHIPMPAVCEMVYALPEYTQLNVLHFVCKGKLYRLLSIMYTVLASVKDCAVSVRDVLIDCTMTLCSSKSSEAVQAYASLCFGSLVSACRDQLIPVIGTLVRLLPADRLEDNVQALLGHSYSLASAMIAGSMSHAENMPYKLCVEALTQGAEIAHMANKVSRDPDLSSKLYTASASVFIGSLFINRTFSSTFVVSHYFPYLAQCYSSFRDGIPDAAISMLMVLRRLLALDLLSPRDIVDGDVVSWLIDLTSVQKMDVGRRTVMDRLLFDCVSLLPVAVVGRSADLLKGVSRRALAYLLTKPPCVYVLSPDMEQQQEWVQSTSSIRGEYELRAQSAKDKNLAGTRYLGIFSVLPDLILYGRQERNVVPATMNCGNEPQDHERKGPVGFFCTDVDPFVLQYCRARYVGTTLSSSSEAMTTDISMSRPRAHDIVHWITQATTLGETVELLNPLMEVMCVRSAGRLISILFTLYGEKTRYQVIDHISKVLFGYLKEARPTDGPVEFTEIMLHRRVYNAVACLLTLLTAVSEKKAGSAHHKSLVSDKLISLLRKTVVAAVEIVPSIKVYQNAFISHATTAYGLLGSWLIESGQASREAAVALSSHMHYALERVQKCSGSMKGDSSSSTRADELEVKSWFLVVGGLCKTLGTLQVEAFVESATNVLLQKLLSFASSVDPGKLDSNVQQLLSLLKALYYVIYVMSGSQLRLYMSPLCALSFKVLLLFHAPVVEQAVCRILSAVLTASVGVIDPSEGADPTTPEGALWTLWRTIVLSNGLSMEASKYSFSTIARMDSVEIWNLWVQTLTLYPQLVDSRDLHCQLAVFHERCADPGRQMLLDSNVISAVISIYRRLLELNTQVDRKLFDDYVLKHVWLLLDKIFVDQLHTAYSDVLRTIPIVVSRYLLGSNAANLTSMIVSSILPNIVEDGLGLQIPTFSSVGINEPGDGAGEAHSTGPVGYSQSGDSGEDGPQSLLGPTTSDDVKFSGFRWQTKCMALELVRLVVVALRQRANTGNCVVSSAHMSLKKARETGDESQYLADHIAILIRTSYQGISGNLERLQAAGLELLRCIIQSFGPEEDPDVPGISLLDQHEAQIMSALRTIAVKNGAPCALSLRLCAEIIETILGIDRLNEQYINLRGRARSDSATDSSEYDRSRNDIWGGDVSAPVVIQMLVEMLSVIQSSMVYDGEAALYDAQFLLLTVMARVCCIPRLSEKEPGTVQKLAAFATPQWEAVLADNARLSEFRIVRRKQNYLMTRTWLDSHRFSVDLCESQVHDRDVRGIIDIVLGLTRFSHLPTTDTKQRVRFLLESDGGGCVSNRGALLRGIVYRLLQLLGSTDYGNASPYLGEVLGGLVGSLFLGDDVEKVQTDSVVLLLQKAQRVALRMDSSKMISKLLSHMDASGGWEPAVSNSCFGIALYWLQKLGLIDETATMYSSALRTAIHSGPNGTTLLASLRCFHELGKSESKEVVRSEYLARLVQDFYTFHFTNRGAFSSDPSLEEVCKYWMCTIHVCSGPSCPYILLLTIVLASALRSVVQLPIDQVVRQLVSKCSFESSERAVEALASGAEVIATQLKLLQTGDRIVVQATAVSALRILFTSNGPLSTERMLGSYVRVYRSIFAICISLLSSGEQCPALNTQSILNVLISAAINACVIAKEMKQLEQVHQQVLLPLLNLGQRYPNQFKDSMSTLDSQATSAMQRVVQQFNTVGRKPTPAMPSASSTAVKPSTSKPLNINFDAF